MGQLIEITNTARLDDVLLIDTDRSLTGQDGETYTTVEDAVAGTTFPAKLAERLLTDGNITSVYAFSNGISVKRRDGWDVESEDRVKEIVSEFFVFYR